MAKKDKIKAEQEFLKTYSSDAFEKPSVAVDLLVFTVEDGKLKIVTVRRQEYPFKGELALPGVFVGMTESVDEAAKRGISEEDAVALIVGGYASDVLQRLPMEFAIEARRLLSVNLEGSVG